MARRGAHLNLGDINEVVKDTTRMTPAYQARAREIERLVSLADQRLAAAADRIRSLPSARPGHTGRSIADTVLDLGEVMPATPGVFLSQRRLSTPAGIRDAENWAKIGEDAVRAAGSQQRQNWSRYAAKLRQYHQDPQDPARRLYSELGQLDSQAIFILDASGFWQRVVELVGNGAAYGMKYDDLFDDQADEEEWERLLQELKNARQYNRRVMGSLW